jgi:hypothetical protein
VLFGNPNRNGVTMSNDSPASAAVSPAPPADADYATIYAALAATERGRRFLAEHAGRSRTADTDSLLKAIARLEAAMHSRQDPAVTGGADVPPGAAPQAGNFAALPSAPAVPAAEDATALAAGGAGRVDVEVEPEVVTDGGAEVMAASGTDEGAVTSTGAAADPAGRADPAAPFPGHAPPDLLAAVEALSEEEKIALCS